MRVSARAKDVAGKVEDQILFRSETHNQGHWGRRLECGTTACAAGWTCILTGHPLVFSTYGSSADFTSAFECSQVGPDLHARFLKESPWDSVRPDEAGIGFVARKMLGINREEANWLFCEERTREEVLAGLQAIRKGDKVSLAELVAGEADGD